MMLSSFLVYHIATIDRVPTLLQGWLPRTGLQYGVDFVLYQKHPALAHSDYSVIIQTDTGGGGGGGTYRDGAASDGDSLVYRPPMTWHDVQITNRLTAQVGKRLLIVRVHDPAPRLGYSSPTCIDRVSISEYVVRRWVPESHR